MATLANMYSRLFERSSSAGPNRLVISLQPHDSITLTILAKNPGETMRLRPVDLRLDMDASVKTPRVDPSVLVAQSEAEARPS